MRVIYTAKNFSGETKGGEMNVKDERDLAGQLRMEGFTLTSFKELEEEKDNKIAVRFFDRFFTVPLVEKMVFTRNLSVMIASGLPLSRALKNITSQLKNKKFVKILEKVQEDIQAGSMFADGLAKYPGVFNELFVNMIRVGESGGNLEEVLNILAVQLEKEHELVSKIRGALIYPAVIIVAMIGIGILMMIYVVPQLTDVFKDLGSELPPTTQFILNTSSLLRENLLLVIMGTLVSIILLRFLFATNSGRKIMGLMLIHIPVIRNLVVKSNCARFARIYSSLLKSGVPAVESLKILSRTLSNFYYKRALEHATESIQKGVSLSKVIYAEKNIFPVLVPQMIEVGEETGKTEAVLLKLAEFYEEEINQFTKNISSVIEPVLMIIIGSAVGFFAISILQPMYSVLESIK